MDANAARSVFKSSPTAVSVDREYSRLYITLHIQYHIVIFSIIFLLNVTAAVTSRHAACFHISFKPVVLKITRREANSVYAIIKNPRDYIHNLERVGVRLTHLEVYIHTL